MQGAAAERQARVIAAAEGVDAIDIQRRAVRHQGAAVILVGPGQIDRARLAAGQAGDGQGAGVGADFQNAAQADVIGVARRAARLEHEVRAVQIKRQRAGPTALSAQGAAGQHVRFQIAVRVGQHNAADIHINSGAAIDKQPAQAAHSVRRGAKVDAVDHVGAGAGEIEFRVDGVRAVVRRDHHG